jgi:Ni,Fe-hydrogenase I large subunit
MSHILHFYHLVALDYVDVNGTGLIPKGFFAPNYDNNYYARGIDPILQTGGLPSRGVYNGPAYTVNNLHGNSGLIPGVAGDLTAYLAGQYVRALKFRRLAQQIGALFTGKMPQASAYTPGCMTTKAYDPDRDGADPDVVKKFAEIMWAGPGFSVAELRDRAGVWDSLPAAHTHPLNGATITADNPHPESILGFIGKPSDFWNWAADLTGTTGGLNFGFAPEFLPPWAAAGAAGFGPLSGQLGAGPWKYGGTFMFDTVAAAHCFPEYFWLGSGYGRTLAWGIFEGASKNGVSPETKDCALNYPDLRAITRGRTDAGRLYNTGGSAAVGYLNYPGHALLPARHLDAREFTNKSAYVDSVAKLASGRHMWSGKTKAEPLNANGAFPPGTPSNSAAYTYAKSPRYDSVGNGNPADFVPYEVGPYARMMANAAPLGGSATVSQVLAVDAGQVGAYYPGILGDVDKVLNPAGFLGPNPIGVFPTWGANLKAHLEYLGANIGAAYAPVFTNPVGSPVFYLTPNALNAGVIFSPGLGVPGNGGFGYDYYGDATLDRIAARTLETYYVARQMVNWFGSLTPGVNSSKTLFFDWGNGNNKPMPKFGAKGAGLTEAPRGALGHWIVIGKGKKDPVKFKAYKGKTANYQIITPTTWNINPKDHLGKPGPAEECMMDTPLVNHLEPIECLRVYHSFDFCCACTVHVMKKKKEVAKVTMEALP